MKKSVIEALTSVNGAESVGQMCDKEVRGRNARLIGIASHRLVPSLGLTDAYPPLLSR